MKEKAPENLATAAPDDDTSDQQYDYSESSNESSDGADQKNKKVKIVKKEYKLQEAVFPNTMIKAQGKNRLQWDLLIIVLSIYQAISIPIDIAFQPDIFNSPSFKTLDSLIDLIFMTDIVFRFRTTYIDPVSGEEVMDSMLISKRYLFSTNFIIDVLSTVPIADLTGGSFLLQLLGLLKLLRVQRISEVIMNLNNSQEVKAGLKVIYLVFGMFLYIHLMGCVWYLVVTIEEGGKDVLPATDALEYLSRHGIEAELRSWPR